MAVTAHKALNAAMSEDELQAAICELLDLFGWRWMHQRPARTSKGWRTAISGHKGFPDIIAVRGSRIVTIELKSEKGRPTPDQDAWGWALAKAGAESYVWHPSNLPSIAKILQKGPVRP